MYMTFYNEIEYKKPHCENEVNFWLDKWSTILIVDWLRIPNHLHNKLEAKVAHFISNGSWSIPDAKVGFLITYTIPCLSLLLQSLL